VHAFGAGLIREETSGPAALPLGLQIRPARQLNRIRRTAFELGLGLIAAGAVVLLFALYELVGTNLTQSRSQHHLRGAFAALTTQSPGPPPTNISAGGPVSTAPLPSAPPDSAVAHLVIPKIGVDQIVVEGVGVGDLQKGPGHYTKTPLPGEPGNAAIAGHRTTYGAPFYHLDELAAGDDVFITTRAGKFRYQVTGSSIVKPSDVSVLNPSPDNRLTLTTCNPRFSAAQRLVVVGVLAGLPAPPPITGTVSAGIGGPAATPPAPPALAGDLGHGTSAAWPPTILYGLVVLAGWIIIRLLGGANRRRGRHAPRGPRSGRGRRWAVHLGGISLCLIPLWFCFENAARLLPQSI
jgi:sortase A